MKGTKLVQALRIVWEKAPHPSPLPEGEGTDWGILVMVCGLQAMALNPKPPR